MKYKQLIELKSNYFKDQNFAKNLEKISNSHFKPSKIQEYYHVLLFLSAHSQSEEHLKIINTELAKINIWCKSYSLRNSSNFDNTGLPYSNIYSFFSFTICNWIFINNINIDINDIPDNTNSINELLQFTLPQTEIDICQYNYSNSDILRQLNIKSNSLEFLLNQLNNSNLPFTIKEYLFEKLKAVFEVKLNSEINIHSNKLSFSKNYFHHSLQKKIDPKSWFGKRIPKASSLTESQLNEIERTSKLILMLLQRETDPVTYMDKSSVRYYELENGISIALFTMQEEKQQALESYVGFSLFKNGFPAAYGGAWIFANTGLIGINVFEWFRGGESSLFFIQLLRLYSQLFELASIEVEPYQYGKDNVEGIKSGAFWFYYKLGFRPTDSQINNLAKIEFTKLESDKQYQTSEKTLLKFTESNLSLKFNNNKKINILFFKTKIAKFLNKYNINRDRASKDSIAKLKSVNQLKHIKNTRSNENIALLIQSTNLNISKKIPLLRKLLLSSQCNPYLYQYYIRKLLDNSKNKTI
jgi:hypothetical protein